MTILKQRGSVLLYLIMGIAFAAAIGMGMFYMTSTSSLGQMKGNAIDRAQYLALAGKNFALMNWSSRSSWNSTELSLSDAEKFDLSYSGNEMTSTGIINKDTPIEARKEIKATAPSAVNTKKVFSDSFDDLTKWDTGTQVGGHAVTTVSGDKALQVTGSAAAFGSYGVWSFLQFSTATAGADLSTLWQNAGYCLSYDLQVKIANSQPYFVAGLIFKVAGTGDGREFYGVSYMRTKQKYVCYWYGCGWECDDNIPSEIKPNTNGSDGIFTEPLEYLDATHRYSRPAVVLWKRQGGNMSWLAYKLLSSSDYVVNASNVLVDWSNLQVRLIEAYPLDFTNGGPSPLLHGSVIIGSTSGATAHISGTPILTSESWSTSTASGTLTLTNISGTFASGENLLVDGGIRARASGTLGTTKSNYIRVYYGDVSSHGTPNNIPTDNNRLGNPRIITGSGNIIYWPANNVSNWSADNDYMTLVQWETPNSSASPMPVRLGGSGTKEANSIIRDSSLLTPNSGIIDYSGIALHSTGNTATSTYFDDFAVQY